MQIKVTFILITYKMIYYDQSQSFCFSSVCNLVRYVFVRTDNWSELAFRPPDNVIEYVTKGW